MDFTGKHPEESGAHGINAPFAIILFLPECVNNSLPEDFVIVLICKKNGIFITIS